jgi:two-component system cell cycle response regulator DivK
MAGNGRDQFARAAANIRGMKTILQIEDNHANRLLVERVFEKMPEYRLIQASDGESGVGLALDERPDLILVDMGLPDIDGQTVVTLIRQIPELKNTPVVAITAWPEDKAQEIAARYGCDGCITKPIDIRTFPTQIAQFLYGNP